MTQINAEEQLRQLESRGREIVLNPEILISAFPEIDIEEIDFDTIKPGSYRFNKKPSLEFLSKMPYYKSGEIGIVCFNDVWFVTFSEENQLEVPFPLDIKSLRSIKALKCHIHSHPANASTRDFSYLPSDIDLDFCGFTTDSTQFIVSEHGLTVLTANPNISDYRNRFFNWVIHDLKLSKNEFVSNGFGLIKDFCINNLNYRLIPWHEVKNFMDNQEIFTQKSPHK